MKKIVSILFTVGVLQVAFGQVPRTFHGGDSGNNIIALNAGSSNKGNLNIIISDGESGTSLNEDSIGNILIGDTVGSGITSGENNVIIGSFTNVGNGHNNILLGRASMPAGSNQINIGNVFKKYSSGNIELVGGNVGIGTTSPEEKLHIYGGTASIQGNIGEPINHYWRTGSHTLELQNDDRGDVVLSFHRAGASNAAILHPVSGGLKFSGRGVPTDNHLFMSSVGNVGIGMENPAKKLHIGSGNLVNDGINLDNKLEIRTSSASSNDAIIENIKFDGHLHVRSNKGESGGNLLLNGKGGYVAIGIDDGDTVVDNFQIGKTMTFHDGGHKVIGFGVSPTLGWFNRNNPNINGDLDPTKYCGELRYDPNLGHMTLRVSDNLTQEPITAMHIDRSRNVGIGTTNPTEKLEVNGSVKSDGFKTNLNGTMSSSISRNNLTFTRDNLSYINCSNAQGSLAIRTGGRSNIDFVVKNDGNVGIGTTDTKGYKLGVNGKIAATEVKVALYDNWSDFVFEDNYQLPTLKEVENHIAQKGHLKDIPSAKEVAKNGFFLGEMDAKLLQKIEELTLYTIAQEKQIDTQNQKIELLLQRLEKLEANRE